MAIAKKTTNGKVPGTALAIWEQEMAKAAQKQAAVEKPMGLNKRIDIHASSMFIDDKPVPGNKLRVVVLAATHENQYYDSQYQQGVASVPACYAFGDQTLEDPEGAMHPHPKAEKPEGDDNGLCANCWANKMASADTGRGKACNNVRRLIVTTEDALESGEKMKDAEARSLKVPVMSVKNWVSFVHEIKEFNRPYWGVVVEVSVVPDKKSQWQVKFAFVEMIEFTADLYEALQKRIKQAAEDIMVPYPKLEEAQEAPKSKPMKGQTAVVNPLVSRKERAPVALPPTTPSAAKRASAGKY